MHIPFYRPTRISAGGLILSILAISAVPTSIVSAQESSADSSGKKLLDPVVVTATRFEAKKEKIAQKLDIISKEDIQMTPSNDLTDIVRKSAAVDVIQYPNLSSGIGIRGFRPQFSGLNQRTLLLIDGRPAGATNLSQINLNGVERIEVLKGPASSLYGSQAMGGVINVITQRSKGTPGGNAFLEYGSFKTLQAGLNTGGNITSRLDYDLSFSYLERSKDYKIGEDNWLRNAFGYKHAQKNYADRPVVETDETTGDGNRRPFTKLHYFSGALRLGYQINDRWRVDVRGEQFQARDVESPGELSSGSTEASTKDVDRQAIDVSLTGQIGQHSPSVKVYASEENTKNYTQNVSGKPVVPFRSAQGHNAWKGIQVKDVWKLGRHSVILGYDYLNASTNSRRWTNDTTERAPTQPEYALISSAFFGQALLNIGKLTLQPGIRLDHITFDVRETPLLPTYKAGKKTTPFTSPSLGITYALLPSLRAKANIGRAFVTTDAYSVAGYNEIRDSKGRVAVTAGNPDLKNESSLSWDLGLDFNKPQSGFAANVTLYSTKVDNRIAKIIKTVNEPLENGDVITSRATFVNAADAEITGLETELSYDFGAKSDYRYSLKAFWNGNSIIKAKELIVGTDASEIRRDIQNVARNTFNFGVAYDNLNWLQLRLSGRAVGTRKDIDYTDPINPEIEYPQYMVLDFAAQFKIAGGHTIALKLNNVTDENYYEKRGYNLPGRALSVRYVKSF
ncbi:TonB-dependent receptor plug domain-containing protein [Dyadobacter jiangsuensis]|uniref:Iron complex outermembrane receptor protein/vitamin B12 transporter n=1 Tax=Dyadobacter jiangsuensis TaxID=1591085 RepID=A0A2P8FZW6_9BACT|nr:TonB-dependent receptor [Dyadobacter jiangsuensis]PSL27271.1 iron complex outermembrane receptor protein/vitamin B12 transporter [Dyadobacter jiangsuensis]